MSPWLNKLKKSKKLCRISIFSVKSAQKWYSEQTAVDIKKETQFWKKKVVIGDLNRRIEANMWNKTRDFSL